MNLASDLLDKYTPEQVTAYLDKMLGGVLKNYQISLEKGESSILWANIGDISQVKNVLHEMRKRDEERLARVKSE